MRSLIDIRKLVLKNFIANDSEYLVDQAYRYYSKTYSTPLADAYKVNMYEIVRIYLDDQFHDAKVTVEEAQDLLQEMGDEFKAIIAPEETVAKALDDDDWIAQQEKEILAKEKAAAAAEERKKALASLSKIVGKTADALASSLESSITRNENE